MKPNCIVIGAMKAGTTSLHHYLDAHPDISMTAPKETHYFSRNYDKGKAWYLEQFADMQTQIRGESSPSYTRYPNLQSVPKRMNQCVPEAKLIYLLRNPLERTISHYKHSVLVGAEYKSINAAIQSNLQKYVSPSKYYMQLKQYLQYYDMSDILVLESNNLRNDTRETVQEAYNFLGVDPHFTSSEFHTKRHQTENRKKKSSFDRFILDTLNGRRWLKPYIPHSVLRTYQKLLQNQKKPSVDLDEKTRNMLENELREDVSKLRELTGRTFSVWSL